jgi:hypothetical protein
MGTRTGGTSSAGGTSSIGGGSGGGGGLAPPGAGSFGRGAGCSIFFGVGGGGEPVGCPVNICIPTIHAR